MSYQYFIFSKLLSKGNKMFFLLHLLNFLKLTCWTGNSCTQEKIQCCIQITEIKVPRVGIIVLENDSFAIYQSIEYCIVRRGIGTVFTCFCYTISFKQNSSLMTLILDYCYIPLQLIFSYCAKQKDNIKNAMCWIWEKANQS